MFLYYFIKSLYKKEYLLNNSCIPPQYKFFSSNRKGFGYSGVEQFRNNSSAGGHSTFRPNFNNLGAPRKPVAYSNWRSSYDNVSRYSRNHRGFKPRFNHQQQDSVYSYGNNAKFTDRLVHKVGHQKSTINVANKNGVDVRKLNRFIAKRLRQRRWYVCKKSITRRKRFKRYRYIRLLFRRLFRVPSRGRRALRIRLPVRRVPSRRHLRRLTSQDYFRFNRRKFWFRSKISLRYFWVSRYGAWTQRRGHLQTLRYKTNGRSLMQFIRREEMNLLRFAHVWGILNRSWRTPLHLRTLIQNGMLWVNFKPVYNLRHIIKSGDCVFFMQSRFRKFMLQHRRGIGRLGVKLSHYNALLWTSLLKKSSMSVIRGFPAKPRWIFRWLLRFVKTKHRLGHTHAFPREQHDFGNIRLRTWTRYNWQTRAREVIRTMLQLHWAKRVGGRHTRKPLMWFTRAYWRRLAVKYKLSRFFPINTRWSSHFIRFNTFLEASRRYKIIVALGDYTWFIHQFGLYVKREAVFGNYYVQNWFANHRFLGL